MSIHKCIEQRLSKDPAAVAIVGAGEYGAGLVCQLEAIRLLRNGLIVDRSEERIRATLTAAGIAESRVVWAKTVGQINEALALGHVAVANSIELVAESNVQIVVDCTGSIEAGTQLAYQSILSGKHMVEVNVEMDVLLGTYFADLAQRMDVVYTAADGDQPSLTASLVRWAKAIGLEIVMAGKGTYLYSEQEAMKRIAGGVSWSDVAYLDGSKSQIEMAAICNMSDLALDTVGFHKPTATAEEALELFALRKDGGILSSTGVVDFVNCRNSDGTNGDGRLAHGVFVIVTSSNSHVLRLMRNKGALMSRDGKRALIYRSHHLCGIETPWSILQALVYHTPTGVPGCTRQVEVVATAKQDLSAGQVLDGLGGTTVRGVAYTAHDAFKHNLLPIGLCNQVVLGKPVKKGDTISYLHLVERGVTLPWHLRGLQDISQSFLKEGES